MENEEKEDLLLEVTESEDDIYEKDEYDCYIEEKVLDFIKDEKQSRKSTKKTFIFIASCLLMFLSSSVFIVTLPIYLQYSTRSKISTYSKLVTLSTINVVLFGIAHFFILIGKWILGQPSCFRPSIRNVFKIGFFFSTGSIVTFWLTDGNYVSCHLQDPLKGCAVVFSFLFYFILARKRMSVERIFCAVTVIVGVFVAIDFGICDKFKCNGSPISLVDNMPRLHFLYIILYIIAHGLWVLHLTYIEISWTGYQSSNSNLSLSVLSNVSKNTACSNDKQACQSLSIICQDSDGVEKDNDLPAACLNMKKKKSFFSSKICSTNRILKFRRANSVNSLNSSVPCANQMSVPICKEFPITSTPVHDNTWDSSKSFSSCDIAFWEHAICCVCILFFCWLPTVSFLHNGKSKLLVEVINEICQSFLCHLGMEDSLECNYLFIVTVIMTASYLVFILSSMKCLTCCQSAVTVVSILTLCLPMSSLWWSLYHLNRSSDNDVLEFKPEITGETVCAMLGFPIIGVGSLLLLKSHIRQFKLSD